MNWSNSKWWRQLGNAVATYVIIINAKGISAELLGTYLAIISGTEVFKYWLATKSGVMNRRSTDGNNADKG